MAAGIMLPSSWADFLFLAMAPAVGLAFSFTCLGFMLIDLRLLPAWVPLPRKSQDKPPPTWNDYCELWPVVLVQNGMIGLVLIPPVALVFYRFMGVEATAPSIPYLFVDILRIAVIFDLWFTIVHRSLHTPLLYRFHKRHHTWKAPCAFEGGYFDIVDFIVGNFGALIFIPPLVTKHYYSILVFGVAAAVSVAFSHSGYTFESPFMWLLKPGTHHDLHHEFFIFNYSHFGWLDYFCGTNLSTKEATDRRQFQNAKVKKTS